ncbi:MAG: hypothetical protein ACLPSH_10565 [Vulcanimicrobiaceae bacterium]
MNETIATCTAAGFCVAQACGEAALVGVAVAEPGVCVDPGEAAAPLALTCEAGLGVTP